jgi:hypothetical protein
MPRTVRVVRSLRRPSSRRSVTPHLLRPAAQPRWRGATGSCRPVPPP